MNNTDVPVMPEQHAEECTPQVRVRRFAYALMNDPVWHPDLPACALCRPQCGYWKSAGFSLSTAMGEMKHPLATLFSRINLTRCMIDLDECVEIWRAECLKVLAVDAYTSLPPMPPGMILDENDDLQGEDNVE